MKISETYEQAWGDWRWDVPDRFNMGVSVCDAQDAKATALIVPQPDGGRREYTFGDLKALSSRLSNLFVAHGLQRGDRVAVLLPQMPETLVAHIAGYRAGLVVMPLAQLFGPDALEYRLSDSGARAIVTDRASCENIAQIRESLPDLQLVLSVDGPADDGAGGADPDQPDGSG